MLSRLGPLAIRRPVVVAGAWWSMVLVLAVIGLGVGNRLHRTNLTIPGTGAARAEALQERTFGPRNPVSIVLQGPSAAIDAQGPALTRAIARIPYVTVFGPWSGGAISELRPHPGAAMLIAVVHRKFEAASRYAVPALRRVLRRVARPPVATHMTGFIDAADAIHQQTLSAIERGELIAAPILLVVLMLVLGSPVAASIPLVLGGSIVAASTGVLDLINRITPLDSVSLNLASMMGLALGVDYALLMVARFRREQAAGASVEQAAATALATAGRTVRFAGVVLALAMITALFLSPGSILLSAAAGVLTAVALSLLASYTVLPAALVVQAPYLDRWRLLQGAAANERVGHRAFALIRRPGIAAAAIAAGMLVLATPALGIATGPPDPRELPASTTARSDFDAIQRALGGAWTAPFEITVASRHGPITDSRMLAALARFERRVRHERYVLSTVGPGEIQSRTAALRSVPVRLAGASRQVDQGTAGISRLESGLGQAGSGADKLAQGLGAAAAAANQIAAGGSRGRDGAQALRTGIGQAMDGARTLSDGLAQAADGTQAVSAGTRRSRSGAAALSAGLDAAASGVRGGAPQLATLASQLDLGADGLNRLREPAQIAQQQLQQTLSALSAMPPTSRLDGNWSRAYQAAATAYAAVSGHNPTNGAAVQPGYAGLDPALAQASTQARLGAATVRGAQSRLQALLGGLDRLARGARRLETGLGALQSGVDRLASGGSRLRAGVRALVAGIARLQSGGGALSDGLWSLAGGSSKLASGLTTAHADSGTLTSGIGQLQSGTRQFATRTAGLRGQFSQLGQLAPLFGSGYAVLAALDTATPAQRNAATFAVNLDRGGNAAELVVVKDGLPTHAHDKLRAELERDAAAFGRETGAQVAVGGPAPTLEDFDLEVRHAYIPYILALSLITYLVLIPILRSLVLPAIAVALNLLTVGAGFGVLVATFQGSKLLGGAGYIDDLMVSAVFNVVFALSIDYEVFLLARVREGYDRLGDTDAAIRYALEHTAGVITGAAAIMTAVFFAFALSPVINLRQLGLGLTVAVVLDATVVRLILLPACLRLAGRWNWWLPRPLERILPRIAWEGEREPQPVPELEVAPAPQAAVG
jgi:putative drug exporter of the RND superfamily